MPRCLHSYVMLCSKTETGAGGLIWQQWKALLHQWLLPTESMATSSFLPYAGNLPWGSKGTIPVLWKIHLELQGFQGAWRNPTAWTGEVCKAGICRNNLSVKAEKGKCFLLLIWIHMKCKHRDTTTLIHKRSQGSTNEIYYLPWQVIPPNQAQPLSSQNSTWPGRQGYYEQIWDSVGQSVLETGYNRAGSSHWPLKIPPGSLKTHLLKSPLSPLLEAVPSPLPIICPSSSCHEFGSRLQPGFSIQSCSASLQYSLQGRTSSTLGQPRLDSVAHTAALIIMFTCPELPGASARGCYIWSNINQRHVPFCSGRARLESRLQGTPVALGALV